MKNRIEKFWNKVDAPKQIIHISDFCEKKECEHFVKWEFYGKNLLSCKLQGESDLVYKMAKDCPFRSAGKKV
jgi:hypothetical protein